MRLLKLHPAPTRGELDPLPFPVNAVRQLMNNRTRRAQANATSEDAVENVELALAHVDEKLAEAQRQNEAMVHPFRPFRPFLARDEGPRAA